ncbi:MAG: hypothetical protein H0U99_08800 [Chthoniobacterales bacterium]|nr:hypothetical protein [Chthoniobacterales bacterium]
MPESKLLVASSLLAADFARLGEEIHQVIEVAPIGFTSTSWTDIYLGRVHAV